MQHTSLVDRVKAYRMQDYSPLSNKATTGTTSKDITKTPQQPDLLHPQDRLTISPREEPDRPDQANTDSLKDFLSQSRDSSKDQKKSAGSGERSSSSDKSDSKKSKSESVKIEDPLPDDPKLQEAGEKLDKEMVEAAKKDPNVAEALKELVREAEDEAQKRQDENEEKDQPPPDKRATVAMKIVNDGRLAGNRDLIESAKKYIEAKCSQTKS